MQLELKDIKGGILEQEYICSVAEFPDLIGVAKTGGPVFKDPLVFQLRFQQTGQFVEVDGRLEVTARLKCGRCLQGFERSLTDSFTLTFLPLSNKIENEEEVELEADDLGMIPYVDDTLELQGALQEQLLMATPLSPVCDLSCKGLCPECGTNLNMTQCDCVNKIFNSKFNVLADVGRKES